MSEGQKPELESGYSTTMTRVNTNGSQKWIMASVVKKDILGGDVEYVDVEVAITGESPLWAESHDIYGTIHGMHEIADEARFEWSCEVVDNG